jgi:hypothetical protein
LAGIALDDPVRARTAETALLGAITSPDLPARLDHPGLCHGIAGALLITRRVATDSADHHLSTQLGEQSQRLYPLGADPALRAKHGTQLGLLDGPAGTALGLDDNSPSGPGWDACLLTS